MSDGEDEDEFEEAGLGSFHEKDDFEDDVPFEDDEDKQLGESESISFSYYSSTFIQLNAYVYYA